MSVSRKLYPGSSVATRLALAGGLWTGVGSGLTCAGLFWLTSAGAIRAGIGLGLAVLIGWAKARWVLAPRARSNVRRILDSGEIRCAGGVFPWRTWLLVLSLMVAGAAIRMSPLPRFWLGVIYTAVGTALIGASVVAWRGWREFRARHAA